MSFFAAPLNCRSIILETEKPEIVSAIGFMPRNDDNFVWQGHRYRLLYFDSPEKGWLTAGEKVADGREIGKNYTELNMRDSAEHYLRRSTLRCPNRLYPHYLLMKLYLKEPTDSAAALREAKILLSTKEKVPSPAIKEMRKEARRINDRWDLQ